MSTEKVPNEVLERILDYTLAIPTAAFERWRQQHTYATNPTFSAPIGAILAVSKRWYDIGIPLLYESAMLRCRGQASGFADALHNPRLRSLQLGRRVRRLRIESGYSSLAKILHGAPGITDLFLGLNLVNDDTVEGLQRALKKTNPSRLFLDRLQWSHNMRFEDTLIKAIAVALPEWKHLTRIDTSPEAIIWPALLQPLSKAPALEYVCLPASTATVNIDGDVLEAISRNPCVKIIHIPKANHRIVVSSLQARADRVPQTLYIGSGKDMVPILDFPVNVIKENPVPLPELPDKIWERILRCATEECAYNYKGIGQKDQLNRLSSMHGPVNRTRRNILLISKRFHRLGLPCMYAIPHFAPKSAVRSVIGFTEQIRSSSALADLVRVLYSQDLPERMSIHIPLKNLIYASRKFAVFPVLTAQLPDGERPPLQWMEQELVDAESIPPTAFLKFSQLQTIILHGGRTDGGGAEELADALPNLEILGLVDVDASLLDLFASMRLPSLRGFSIEGTNIPTLALARFLRAHGAKLHALSVSYSTDIPDLLDLCPNLVELILIDKLPPGEGIRFVETCTPHASIERIVFARQTLSAHYLRDLHTCDVWYDFIRFLADRKTQLPALREIRVGTIVWPLVESEARSSMGIYVAWFLNEAGLALADSAGRRCRRLAPVPQSVQRKQRLIST